MVMPWDDLQRAIHEKSYALFVVFHENTNKNNSIIPVILLLDCFIVNYVVVAIEFGLS